MTDGLAAVQARVAELRALVSPTPPSTSSTTTGTSSTSGTDFSALMGQLTGGGSDAVGSQAVEIGKKYLGVDYKWGGTDPKTGLDCSGFTQLVYKQLGVDLPRVSQDQAKVGTKVGSLDDAKPGDLVFFGSPVHHVGIYVGDGKMIDAPKTGDKVKIQDVWETPSQIRRVSQLSPQASAGTGNALVGLSGLSSSSALSALGATSGTSATSGSGAVSGTPYDALFNQMGKKYGVDPTLLAAVAKAESGFNAKAVSGAGAQGLMQIMPGTARELGVNALNPTQAVDGAARLLKQHLKSFDGRVDLALAAYNAGPGAVRRYDGVPPYKETQNYVKKVIGFREAM